MGHFPTWNPQKNTLFRILSIRGKVGLKALRNSSSAFISNYKVRGIILSRDGHSCNYCASTDNLEIDHIASVVSCFHGHIAINELNTEKNLQVLCSVCNRRKAP